MKNLILFSLIFFSFYAFTQEQKKDTLFIKYDYHLLKKYEDPIGHYKYYLIKDTGNNGTVSFEEKQRYVDLKPKKIHYLKDILNKADVYYKNNLYKKGKINDSKLADYLAEYVIFLIKDKISIKILVVHEIE